ncbi:MAG: hypothetical protein OEW12_09425 [Deltaproteobacteria bacterium]|nr:hypothetical protein [Deltaproteobacteria bacterium]
MGKHKKLRIGLYPHQAEVFDSPQRHVVYVKGRRAGGTRGAAHRLMELAHRPPVTRHLWVDTAFHNIEKYVQRYFIPSLGGTKYIWRKSSHVLRFEGGSYCDFASAERPENMEGFGYDCIWVNEAGILLKNEALYWQSLMPMVLESPKAQLFFFGAPKGPGLFQAMYQWGQDPERPDWRSVRHSSHINPGINRQELDRQRLCMPEREYRQEILAEFVEQEGAVFKGVDKIAIAQPEPCPVPSAPYVLGVDLARYGDYTVIWVGRTDTREAVYCERLHQTPWKEQVARISMLAARYGHGQVFVDATGVGDPVAEDLRASGLAVEAVVLGTASKRQLIDHLAVSIEQERVRMVPHSQTLKELAAFQFTRLPSGGVRSSASGGGHDDCVIALALCVWGMWAWSGGFITGQRMVSSETDW